MDIVIFLVLVAAVFGGWWWWNKRRPAPVEDTWVLPPESEAPVEHLRSRTAGAAGREAVERPGYVDQAAAQQAGASGPAAEPRVILDREALLNRDRTFDPRNWDNTPDDPAAGPVEGELPKTFDREYLERQAREREDRSTED